MESTDVVWFVRLLGENGIDVWLDGGWSVDALLGQRTRPHDDLDIVIQDADGPRLIAVLAVHGFDRVEGGRPFNFVLADGRDRRVDVHTIVFDEQGNGLYGPPQPDGRQKMYAAGALTGRGMVGGEAVRCTSPEFLMGSHSGYEISPTDWHDLQALHDRFGLDLPEEYQAVHQIRPALPGDVTVLSDMLVYAARWRPGQEHESRAAVLTDDHVIRYVEGWGRSGDLGFIAEDHGKPVGAVWLRLFPRGRAGYGFIDEAIPELSIAVLPARRGSGIGMALLSALLRAAREAGHHAVSLSVEGDNPAGRLYERVGFSRVAAVAGAWTMRADLTPIR